MEDVQHALAQSLLATDPDRGGCYSGGVDVTIWVLVAKRNVGLCTLLTSVEARVGMTSHTER